MKELWTKIKDWWLNTATWWQQPLIIIAAAVVIILMICFLWKLILPLLTIAAFFGWPLILVAIDRREKAKRKATYYNSSYYAVTHNEYDDVRRDAGKLQEYQISQLLVPYEQAGAKLLFNAYIPKKEGTTEIDVLMISSYGLFVFESKNYSGWIFGNSRSQQWTQTLRTGRYSSHKEHFYNPIKQNSTHIYYLKKLLPRDIPTQSIIVFSDRCEFMDVDTEDADADVIYLSQVTHPVRYAYERQPVQLTPDEIQDIYDIIYPYTQVSEEVKQAHIWQIEQMHR